MRDDRLQTGEEALLAVSRAAFAAGLIIDVDLPAVLRQLDRFDTLAPLAQPSKWLEFRDRAEEKRSLLEAALPLWRWAQAQKIKHGTATGRSEG